MKKIKILGKELNLVEYLPWLIVNVFWGIFFCYIFWNMIFFKDGKLWAGHEYVWSDWALHLGIANIFALKPAGEWFSYHPIFALGKFTYPFLANMISGLLMRSGWTMESAFFWPSWITSLFLVNGLYVFYREVIKSKCISAILVFVFFGGYGLNFLGYIYKAWINGQYLNIVGDAYYSRIEAYQWGSGNPIVGMLVPQRAFLLGMAVTVWVMWVLVKLIFGKLKNKKDSLLLFIAGIIGGFLVIIHPHSLIVLGVVFACWFGLTLKNWKKWLYFVLPLGFVSIILYLIFIRGGISNPKFMSWMLGWTTHGVWDWFWFWLRVFGLVWPLAIIGIVLMFWKKDENKNIIWPFVVIFALANLFLFQPVAWDNSKIFLWSYFGLLIPIGYFIKYLFNNKKYFFVIIIFIFLTAAGSLDLIKLWIAKANPLELAGENEIALAEFIKINTDTQARILTTTNHNNPVMMMAARPILLGYTAWVWNYGCQYEQVEKDIKLMYENPAKNEELFNIYKLRYVLIGPSERNEYIIDQSYFVDNMNLIYKNDVCELYKIT